MTGWSFIARAMEPWILILPERKADCGLREPDASLAKFSSEVVTVMSSSMSCEGEGNYR